jgi:hypothetical protein
MLIAGLEAEVADYIERCDSLVDEAGHRLVVRNGRAAERSLVPPVHPTIFALRGRLQEPCHVLPLTRRQRTSS